MMTISEPMAKTNDAARGHLFVCGMSRSGTSLLAAVFDAHPAVSMAYELLPGPLGNLESAATRLEDAIAVVGDQPRAVGRHLTERADSAFAKFVRRCGRTSVAPSELVGLLREQRRLGKRHLYGVARQAELAMRVVELRRCRESTSICGFKINTSGVASVRRIFPDAQFVYILRDPRDVVASHFDRGFDRSLKQIAHAWNQYARRFLAFARAHPERAWWVRYEDLVRRPRETLEPLLNQVGPGFHPDVLEFFRPEKGSIHAFGHANSTELRRNFFTSSLGRWRTTLSQEQVREVEAACRRLMERAGDYSRDDETMKAESPTRPTTGQAPRLNAALRRAKQRAFSTRKQLHPQDYESLLAPFLGRYRPLTLRQAAVERVASGEKILLIRHDIDHDFETARQMARWEHDRSLPATYCILHTAWYYAAESGGEPSAELLELCAELAELGHEINLHSNFGVLALQQGKDPRSLLEQELGALRSRGVSIVGTSGHGDALCREANFFNLEIFAGRAWDSKGGPRRVEWQGRHLDLGVIPMEEVELAYEAYDLPRDIYVTDSGGRPRLRYDTRGRGGVRRAQALDPIPYPEIVGVLTHPIWWNFEDCRARSSDAIAQVYQEAALEARLRSGSG